jgi:two-component system, cell cycle response regulator CpdR
VVVSKEPAKEAKRSRFGNRTLSICAQTMPRRPLGTLIIARYSANSRQRRVPLEVDRLRFKGSFDGRLDGEVTLASTVLVVDDEPLVLDITASMLEELGCEVMTAANGIDALTMLTGNCGIEILITDINMPGMDGYELAERAQKEREGLKVIVLSGGAIDGHGFPLVRKPFLQRDLVRAMG